MNNVTTNIKALKEETLINLKNSKAVNTLRAYKSDSVSYTHLRAHET